MLYSVVPADSSCLSPRRFVRTINIQEAKKKVMAEFIEEERRRDEALAKQVQRVDCRVR